MKTIQIVGDSKFGGATYLLIEWCRYLLNKGVEVHALTTDEPTIEQLIEIPGLHIMADVLIPREISPLKIVRAAFALRSLLKQEEYDVLHTYSSTPGFLGRIVGKFSPVPVVMHHQAGFPVSEFSSRAHRLIFGRLESMAINAATKSICVSHAVMEQSKTLGIGRADKLVTICNGIDIEPWELAARDVDRLAFCKEIDVDPDTLLIAATGRLADQKGLPYLLRALPQIREGLAETPVVVVLAGEGPAREQLEAIIEELSLQNNVRMLGFRRDVPRIVAACDIFCSPSLWEGLSISIMEAMAAQKPIVTTDILPNAELIDDGETGLLVKAREVDGLAAAIVRMATDSALADACVKAAHTKVRREYTIKRMFDETWDLYNQLLDEASARTRN
ncbi:MAG: glycosyltransferase [Armatimonadetes bacterium]|nr:glycosyltransferase [Armatimonadota bacterium]